MIPGLLLGLWSFWMRPAPSAAANHSAASGGPRAGWRIYLDLLKTPSYTLNTLGMTAMTFAMGAYAFFMPEYLRSHNVGAIWGIPPRAMFGATTAVAGILGTLCGGIVGDACRTRWPGSYFLVSGGGLLACVPCGLLFLVVPFPAAWTFVFLAEFFLFFNTGPTNTILANVVHPTARAAGFGLNILIIHLLGDAISPPAVGAIADHFNLATGFVFVSGFLLLGGIFWLWGARHLEADTAAAMVECSG